MKKVRLVFHRSFVDHPTFKDTFASTVQVDVPEGFDSIHLAGARVYSAGPAPGQLMATDKPNGDVNACIIDYSDVSALVGKLLTYIDATFTDPEQRKAHKDIVKEKVYDWHQQLRERAVQTVDAHDRFEEEGNN